MTRRLLAAFLAIIAFMLVVLGIPFWRTILVAEHDALRTRLERDAVVLGTLVEDTLSETSIDAEEGGAGVAAATAEGEALRRSVALDIATRYSRSTGARVVIVDAAGQTLADNESPAEALRSFRTRPEISEALNGRVGIDERYSHTLGRSALFVATPVSSAGSVLGAVRLSYTTAEMDRRIRVKAIRMGLVSVVAVGAALLLAGALARSLIRPLRDLSAATTAFGAGNMRARVSTRSGAPELRSLSREFNAMAARIAELVEAQDLFVADASHQMRSPLTAARLRVEALAYAPAEQLPNDVDAAVDEPSRLSRVIDGLLELARSDQPTRAVPIDVTDVVDDRVDTWSALASERGIRLERIATGPISALVGADRLAQILDNLVANALDASSAGGQVTLSVEQQHDGVAVHVDDQGVGMTEEQRQRAFDRLWRANNRRTDLSGSGLGLSIARKLAEADGGSISLREGLSGGGTRATVWYPTPVG